jgi:DNA-binding CsgD family transcriptional regulator
MKIYNDNHYIFLANNIEITEEYLLNTSSSFAFINSPTKLEDDQKNTFYVFWPNHPKKVNAVNIFLKHNCWNGMSIINRSNDHTNIWWFATVKENDNMQFFLSRNVETLKNFINYFDGHISKFIKPDIKNLAYFKDGFNFNLPENKDLQLNISSFMDHIYLKGLEVKTSNGIIKLTSMEIKCLQSIAKYYSFKEIANNFNISPRTVETYLNRIKAKIGYNLKSDIIKFFYERIQNIL